MKIMLKLFVVLILHQIVKELLIVVQNMNLAMIG